MAAREGAIVVSYIHAARSNACKERCQFAIRRDAAEVPILLGCCGVARRVQRQHQDFNLCGLTSPTVHYLVTCQGSIARNLQHLFRF
eukprot:scaffold277018_cov20-Prasinocladus_malaysianus.AAC.3